PGNYLEGKRRRSIAACLIRWQHPDQAGSMWLFSIPDLVALGVFLGAWSIYAFVIDRSRHGRMGLNSRMNGYRETWMRRMLARENRMVDMQIMSALQNGTAFFASTSLIAIGGALTLLRSTDDMIAVVSSLPLGISASRVLWEAKTIGLAVIFIYAFFKFAWAYRLYNYVAIMLGATPYATEKDTPEAEAHVMRTARLFAAAGRHFNQGQRAFFFAIGYLGWFAGPFVLLASTVAVVVVIWRRQFASDSLRAIAGDSA
ncbi:MAG: hypothetical protein QOC56_1433, partial [Alphaproteobacteria bacterium]|nr:hypothetical protein [Alphaproteobacteria bacterium]